MKIVTRKLPYEKVVALKRPPHRNPLRPLFLLQIVIRDTVILQSGRITPGKQVMTLELDADAAAMLSPGGYEGSFLVFIMT